MTAGQYFNFGGVSTIDPIDTLEVDSFQVSSAFLGFRRGEDF